MNVAILSRYFGVAASVLREAVLWVLGLLDLRALWSQEARTRRIAIQAYAAHLAQFSTPVVTALRAREPGRSLQFECIVLPHPHFTRAEQRRVEQWAASTGIAARRYWRSLWRKYDLVIYLDLFSAFPLRRARSVLMMHGPGLTGRNVEPSPFRKTLADFDLVLVSGEADLRLCRDDARARARGTRIVAAGTPFWDGAQLEAAKRMEYRSRLGLPEDTRLVLVAPSWSGLRACQDQDVDWLADVITEATATRSCSVVVKLHAASRAGFIGGPIDWSERVARLAREFPVVVDDDIDDRPALVHADLLVTDISSRAFAMMLLDKPVLLYWPVNLSRDAWDDKRSLLLGQGARVTTTRHDLRAALDEPWEWGDRATVARACFANVSSATEAVAAQILAELEPSAPVA